jgi:hypothetical protein
MDAIGTTADQAAADLSERRAFPLRQKSLPILPPFETQPSKKNARFTNVRIGTARASPCASVMYCDHVNAILPPFSMLGQPGTG